MKKLKWTTNKALGYVNSRSKRISIKPGFHRQLLALERRLEGPLSDSWDMHHSGEDLVLRNTYLNSRKIGYDLVRGSDRVRPTGKRITWTDHESDDRTALERGSDASGSLHLGRVNHRLKSILKKSQKNFPSHRLNLSLPETPKLAASPALSTAPITPVLSGVLRLGERPASPTPLRFMASSGSANFPSNLTRRPPSPMISRPTQSAGPGRAIMLGRPPSPIVSRPGHSDSSFPLRRDVGLMNIRPPSPARPDRPVSAVLLRPPSPLRIDRPATVAPVTVPFAPVRRTILGSSMGRAPSPMTTALRGPLRPQSSTGPVWRN